jgi:hypothetical protein
LRERNDGSSTYGELLAEIAFGGCCGVEDMILCGTDRGKGTAWGVAAGAALIESVT